MLKALTDIGELGFMKADPFSAVISALAATYGADRDFIRFYVQDDASAISMLDGNVNLYVTERTDYEEIAAFLNVAGYLSIRSYESAVKSLKKETGDCSFIVRYRGGEAKEPDGFVSEYPLRDIYSLLTSRGFDTGDYGYFAADVFARVNKNAASFGGIVSENKLRSCCFRLFEGEKSILLGAVATDINSSGRGYASSLVPYMAKSKKEVFLFTRNDALLPFYENCGFEKYGKYAVSYR